MQEAVMTHDIPDTGPAEAPGPEDSIRRITSHQFGEIEVTSKYVFTFAEGLYGFDNLREFVLISEEQTEPLKWLISMEDPMLGFPVINPLVLDMRYNLGKANIGDSLVPLVIVTLSNANGNMTANMKAPIILDVSSQTGKQIILSSDRYAAEFTIGANTTQTRSVEG